MVYGVPVFYPLNLCLEVYLLSTVWFDTHLLAFTTFVGYKPEFFLLSILLFSEAMEIC